MTIKKILIGLSMGAGLLMATNVMANPEGGKPCMAGQPCHAHPVVVKHQPVRHVAKRVEPRRVVHSAQPQAGHRIAAVQHRENVSGGQGQQQQGQMHKSAVKKPGQSVGQPVGGDR